MKRLPLVVAVIASLGVASVWLTAQGQQVFQASVDLVTIDVSVRTGNLPALGLTAKDFALTDNKVTQTVDMFEMSSLPLDVTIAVDNSGSMEASLDAMASYVAAAKLLLRPDDRLRFLTFSTEFNRVFDFQAVSEVSTPTQLTRGGATSIYDALTAALLPSSPPDRRHLVVAFTDGFDTMSVLGPDALKDVSRRTDSVLYLFLVVPTPPVPGPGPPPGMPSAYSSLRFLNTRRIWTPQYFEDGYGALTESAENTGGRFDSIFASEGFVPGGLKRAIEEYRTSYVLRYRASGVAAAGWHDVNVRVVKPGNYTVRAKKGYLTTEK